MKTRVILSTFTCALMISLLAMSTVSAQRGDRNRRGGGHRDGRGWQNRPSVERDALNLREQSRMFRQTAKKLIQEYNSPRFKTYMKNDVKQYMKAVSNFYDKVRNHDLGYSQLSQSFKAVSNQYKSLRKLFHQVIPVQGRYADKSDGWYFEIMPAWVQLSQQYKSLEEQMSKSPIRKKVTATVLGRMKFTIDAKRRGRGAARAIAKCVAKRKSAREFRTLQCPSESYAYDSAYRVGFKQYRITIYGTQEVSAQAHGKIQALRKAEWRCQELGFRGCVL